MIKIRTETKTVKILLNELFPKETFSIQLKQPSSYVYSSDKIKIKCPKSVNANDVIIALKNYVYNICVFEKGSIASVWDTNIEPHIKMPNGDKIDMEMVEFIEVQ